MSYELTRDLPDNVITEPDGDEVRLGNFASDRRGAWFRCTETTSGTTWGPDLADAIDETGTGPSVWMTRPLRDIGSTEPYLHDGRATSLDEAIRAHGGESAATRDAYLSLGEQERVRLIALLHSLMQVRTLEDEGDDEEEAEEG